MTLQERCIDSSEIYSACWLMLQSKVDLAVSIRCTATETLNLHLLAVHPLHISSTVCHCLHAKGAKSDFLTEYSQNMHKNVLFSRTEQSSLIFRLTTILFWNYIMRFERSCIRQSSRCGVSNPSVEVKISESQNTGSGKFIALIFSPCDVFLLGMLKGDDLSWLLVEHVDGRWGM